MEQNFDLFRWLSGNLRHVFLPQKLFCQYDPECDRGIDKTLSSISAVSAYGSSMASGRVSLSPGLKVSELKDKLAELGLSTQGNKDILRERLHSFFDAGSSNEQDIQQQNGP